MIVFAQTEAAGRQRAAEIYGNIFSRVGRRNNRFMPVEYEATDDVMEGPFVLSESDIYLLRGQGVLTYKTMKSSKTQQSYPKMKINVRSLYQLAIGTRSWKEIPGIDFNSLPKPGEKIGLIP